MNAIKLITAGLILVASIGNHTYAGQKGKRMKKHVCTETCKKEGKCPMAHGEKGHTCTEACKKAEKKM